MKDLRVDKTKDNTQKDLTVIPVILRFNLEETPMQELEDQYQCISDSHSMFLRDIHNIDKLTQEAARIKELLMVSKRSLQDNESTITTKRPQFIDAIVERIIALMPPTAINFFADNKELLYQSVKSSVSRDVSISFTRKTIQLAKPNKEMKKAMECLGKSVPVTDNSPPVPPTPSEPSPDEPVRRPEPPVKPVQLDEPVKPPSSKKATPKRTKAAIKKK